MTKENVAVSDLGVYTCVAVSIAGQARHDIMATVYRAPTVESGDGSTDQIGASKENPIGETPVEESLVLQCLSTAIPPPIIRWYFNEKELMPDKRHAFADYDQQLTIKKNYQNPKMYIRLRAQS